MAADQWFVPAAKVRGGRRMGRRAAVACGIVGLVGVGISTYLAVVVDADAMQVSRWLIVAFWAWGTYYYLAHAVLNAATSEVPDQGAPEGEGSGE